MLNKSCALFAGTVGLAFAAAISAAPSIADRPAVEDNDVQPITGPLPANYRFNRNGSITLRVCFNWSCAEQQFVTFSADELHGVTDSLAQCNGQSLHDRIQRLRVGIWQMQLVAQRHLPQLANDREINEFDKGLEGRLDCVDRSANTNTYLEILRDLKQLPGWTVGDPQVRNLLDFHGVHWTAVVVDQASGKPWSVDSWFRPHGHLPFMMPLADWKRDKKAWDPPYDTENPYPLSIQELCPAIRQAAEDDTPENTAVATLHGR